jgi:hypothetical protein
MIHLAIANVAASRHSRIIITALPDALLRSRTSVTKKERIYVFCIGLRTYSDYFTSHY